MALFKQFTPVFVLFNLVLFILAKDPNSTDPSAPEAPSFVTMLPDPVAMNPYLNRAEKSILLHRHAL